MKSVYDEDNFFARVTYAAQCFIRNTHETLHFDTCFGMFDGDAVVTALVRHARTNPTLYEAIAKQWREGFPKSWIETEARYASWTTKRLSILARELRTTGQRASQQFLEQLQMAQSTDTTPAIVVSPDATIATPSNTKPITAHAPDAKGPLMDQSALPQIQPFEPAQFFQPEYDQPSETFQISPHEWTHVAPCRFGLARPSSFDPRVPWSGNSFRYDIFERAEIKRLALRRQHGGGTCWYILHEYLSRHESSLLRHILSTDHEPTRWDYCHFLCDALERTQYAAHAAERDRWTQALLQKRVKIQRKRGRGTALIIPREISPT